MFVFIKIVAKLQPLFFKKSFKVSKFNLCLFNLFVEFFLLFNKRFVFVNQRFDQIALRSAQSFQLFFVEFVYVDAACRLFATFAIGVALRVIAQPGFFFAHLFLLAQQPAFLTKIVICVTAYEFHFPFLSL